MSPQEHKAWIKRLLPGDVVLYKHFPEKPQMKVIKSIESATIHGEETILIVFTDEPNMGYNYLDVRPLLLPPIDKPIERTLPDFISKRI